MKVYISGKIRGASNEQLALFKCASDYWRARGRDVFNPLEHPTGLPRDIFLRDMSIICKDVDLMVMLKGFSDSKGARAEKALAEAIGIKVRYFKK